MAEIFLSYSNRDVNRIQALVKILQQQGWSVWWDNKIPIGTEFDQIIEEELIKAECVIVVWSENSVKSKWVKNEASEGDKRNCLFPVLIDNVTVPIGFRTIETAKLYDWKGNSDHPELEMLLESIAGIIGRDSGRSIFEELDKPKSRFNFSDLFSKEYVRLIAVALLALAGMSFGIWYFSSSASAPPHIDPNNKSNDNSRYSNNSSAVNNESSGTSKNSNALKNPNNSLPAGSSPLPQSNFGSDPQNDNGQVLNPSGSLVDAPTENKSIPPNPTLEAQVLLKQLGENIAYADGLNGPQTVIVLEKFQRENNLSVTRQADDATLLLLYRKAFEKINNRSYKNATLEAQVLFNQLGENSLSDGIAGPKTVMMLKQIQRENNLPESGAADDATLLTLYRKVKNQDK